MNQKIVPRPVHMLNSTICFGSLFFKGLGTFLYIQKLSLVCVTGPFCMLNSTIRFGTLLFKCFGSFLHNQNCNAFVYPDRFAC